MRYLQVLLLAGLFFCGTFAGPGLAAAKGDAAAKSPTAKTGAGVSSPQERREYEKKMTQELEAVKERLATLKMKVMRGPGQQRRTGLRLTQTLEAQTLNASHQLEKLQKNPGNWDQARAELDKTMADLQQQLTAAEGQVR